MRVFIYLNDYARSAASTLARRYGLTLSQYLTLLIKQGLIDEIVSLPTDHEPKQPARLIELNPPWYQEPGAQWWNDPIAEVPSPKALSRPGGENQRAA